jgi:hypothetical protein
MTRRVVLIAVALLVVMSWSPARSFVVPAGLEARGQQCAVQHERAGRNGA